MTDYKPLINPSTNPPLEVEGCLPDQVQQPSHYTEYPKEVVDIIRFVLEDSGLSPFDAWCVGNELKYRLRAGLKDKDKLYQDIDKAMKVRSWRVEDEE